MKKILIGFAAAMLAAAPAAAFPNYDFHIQYTYLDANGAVIGSFTVYCDGREVSEGVTWSPYYTVIYGSCDAL
ncbi:hypothetical protein [Qipengyuania sp.]|uniref:hypothetical protein n=1 Tax=Qipengyuania sp. TaxID=2004515 RepID=UPI0035195ADD